MDVDRAVGVSKLSGIGRPERPPQAEGLSYTAQVSNRRPRIVVLVGLPGSGKSTWLANQGIAPLSSDAMRVLLADDITDQSIHARVFASLRYLLRHRIAIGRPVSYVDATHLTPKERRPYIEMGRRYGCPVDAVFFDVPPELCKERNRRRNRVVPEEALDRMVAKLVPPSRKEGFARVTVIRADPLPPQRTAIGKS